MIYINQIVSIILFNVNHLTSQLKSRDCKVGWKYKTELNTVYETPLEICRHRLKVKW